MKFSKYNTYSTSEIDWLQNYPSTWDLKRLKDIATIKTGERNTEDKMSDGKYPFFVRSQIVEYIDTYSFNGEAILTAGDGVGVAKVFHHYIGKFETHQRVYRISHFKKVHGRFLFYFLMENLYKEVLKFNAKSTVDSLRLPMFQRFPVFLPPYEEQIQIAKFIDDKTQAIDNRIELLEQKSIYYKELSRALINETVCKGLNNNVPFKDSGIEWIGKIPKHWQVKRLKDVGYLYSGLSGKTGEHFNQEVSDNSQHYIPFTNIANNKYINHEDLHTVLMDENERQNKVKKNDLFFLMSSEGFADIGKSALLIEDVKDTYLNSFCKGYRITKKTVVPKYLNYLLNSPAFRDKFIVQGKGFTRINLKMEKVSDFEFIIPPVEEQKAIAEHLDKKTTTIDAIVANIKLQIDSLKELRKTLINDVVTGKLKVTE